MDTLREPRVSDDGEFRRASTTGDGDLRRGISCMVRAW